jgi:hypothetical protein
VEVAPGDAEDSVAADLQVAVAGAVVLEGSGGVVGLAAVELGDQALLGPQGVDGVGADRLVDLGSFDVVGVEEGEERDLELGLGAGAGEVVAVQDRPQCRCPSALGVACEQGVEGERACEPAVLGLVDRALQSLGVSCPARSRRVRAGVVTGMPRSLVISSAGSVVWWASMPGRRHWRGAVTSIFARRLSQMPHSAAADRWLSTAPGPAARTAASQWPSRDRTRWPTANTPRWIG